MDGEYERRRGRRLLLALLGLNLYLKGILAALPGWGQLPGDTLFLSVLFQILPGAVVLWGLYRASWPALAVFCIGVVTGVGNLVGVLQFNSTAAINSGTGLLAVELLAQVTVLLAIFRHEGVSRYWEWRHARRGRWALAPELILFAAAVLVPLFWVMLL